MNKYEAFIVDFDGTLYHKLPLKMCMLMRIILYLILHPRKYKDILIIKEYRNIRKKRMYVDCDNFYDKQLEYLVNKYRYNINEVKSIINRWMFILPKRYIAAFNNKKLINILNKMYEQNKLIIIYSDYPIVDKISCLNIKYNYLFSSEDKIINCMKPDNKGLINIIKLTHVDKNKILYIGDEDRLDGMCAKKTDIDYINVKTI